MLLTTVLGPLRCMSSTKRTARPTIGGAGGSPTKRRTD